MPKTSVKSLPTSVKNPRRSKPPGKVVVVVVIVLATSGCATRIHGLCILTKREIIPRLQLNLNPKPLTDSYLIIK